jgi:hypothetical protein
MFTRGRRIAACVIAMAAASVAVNSTEASALGFGASWQFTSGQALDSSGNGNNGDVHGGVVRTGSGYVFDGTSGYVSVPNSASLNPGSAPVTLEIAFSLAGNPKPSGADYDLFRKGLAGTKGGDFKMEVLSTGKALCRFKGTNPAVLQGGSNLGVGSHVVRCVKTDTSVELFVDGVSVARKTVAVGPISNTQPVNLGAKPGDDFTKGTIDYITLS